MVWYFYQSQNKFRKRKERLNRKEIRKPYLSPRRSRPRQPTRPTRGRGVFFHLPRPQAARWNATEPAGRPPRHQPAWSPPPRHLLTPGDAQEPPRSIPPPELPPPPPSPFSSPPEEHAGVPSSPRVAIDAEKPPEPVQRLHHRRLRRAVQGIEPGARIDARIVLELPPAAVKHFVDSAAVEPPQPSPPPLLDPR